MARRRDVIAAARGEQLRVATTPQSTTMSSSEIAVSLIIPAYNEASRIAATVAESVAALDALGRRWELLLVDDGSSDSTAAIAREIAATLPDVRVEALPHRGKASAVAHGLRLARGELVFFSDADLATPLRYLAPFIEAAERGVDVVIASREGRDANRIGEPAYRHIMGRVFNWMVQLLLLRGIEDTQCGFKLFSRQAAGEILARRRLYLDPGEVTGARVTAFDVELLVIADRLGYAIASIPVEWVYGPNSKVNPVRDSLQNGRDLLLIKWHDLRGHYRREN